MTDRTVAVRLRAINDQFDRAYRASGQSVRGIRQDLASMSTTGSAGARRLGNAFGMMGRQLGGEFGGIVSHVTDSLDSIEGRGRAARIMAVGGALTGVGIALATIGGKDKAHIDQLRQAITDAGQSYDEYEGQIDKVIKKNRELGQGQDDTRDALRTLVQATGDTDKALGLMGEATDLAAAKHISLNAAAEQLARIYSGKGARALAAFNIQLDKTLPPAQAAQKALDQLAQKVGGQASASVDNFAGKLDVMRTKATDFAKDWAGKVAPYITAAGPLLFTAGAAQDFLAARTARATAAALAEAEAVDAATAAKTDDIAVTTASAAASETEAAAAGTAATATGEEAVAAGAATTANAALTGATTAAAGAMEAEAAAAGAAGLSVRSMALGLAVGLGVTTAVGFGLNKLGVLALGAAPPIDKVSEALIHLSKTGDMSQLPTGKMGAFHDSVERILDPTWDQRANDIFGSLDHLLTLGQLGGNGSTFLRDARQQVDAVDKALVNLVATGHASDAAGAFAQIVAQLQAQGIAVDRVIPLFDDYAKVAGPQLSGMAEAAAASQGTEAAAILANAAAADRARAAMQAQASATLALNSANIAGAQGQIGFDQATIQLRQSMVKGHGVTLDERAALVNYAATVNDLAGKSSNAATVIRNGRSAFIKAAEAAGYGADEAKRLADRYLKIPKVVTTQVRTPGLPASVTNADALQRHMEWLDGRTISTQVHVFTLENYTYRAGERNAPPPPVPRRSTTRGQNPPGHRQATGGWVLGMGSSTSDSVDLAASAGEYLLKASAARRLGPAALADLNNGRVSPITSTFGGVSISLGQLSISLGGNGSSVTHADVRAAVDAGLGHFSAELMRKLRSG